MNLLLAHIALLKWRMGGLYEIFKLSLILHKLRIFSFAAIV